MSGAVGFGGLMLAAALLAAHFFASIVARGRISHAESSRISTIDGLRGYLAVFVVAAHFANNWNYAETGEWLSPSITQPFRNLGSIAVSLFFFITAFLFYRKVTNTETVDWIRLAISRVCRLLPMGCVLSLIVGLVVITRTGPIPFGSWPALAGGLLQWAVPGVFGMPDLLGFENTNLIAAGVLWTLTYEWAFYLSLPVLALIFRAVERRGWRITLLAGFFVACSFRPITLLDLESSRVGLFALGMLAAELVAINGIEPILRTKGAAAITVACLIGAVLLAGYSRWQMLLLLLGFLPVAAGNSLFGILALPGSRVLGDASYSIYLLHGPILYIAMQSNGSWRTMDPILGWAMLPALCVIVVLASSITYRTIERPFIELSRRIRFRAASA